MPASPAREHSGSTAVQQQLEVGMVTLHVVSVLAVAARNQWAGVRTR
jgi:hypothetical protein